MITRRKVLAGIGTGLAIAAVPATAGAQESPGAPPDPKVGPASREAAQPRGPTLRGQIVDEAGRPLAGGKVLLYAGIASRWKVAEATSDADGRYRVEAIRSSMIKNEKENRWDLNVGVRVEHPTHVEADGRSWRDLRIPGVPGHVETLDLRLTTAGHVEGLLKDAKTGEPLKGLDLRIMHPTGTRGHGSTFHAYATTDDRGRFRSLSLFPGEYDVDVNDSTLDYPLIGRVKVEPGKTTSATFDAVSLPRVIEGQVIDAEGKPLDGVEVTLLAPKDSDVELQDQRDFSKVRTRAWTITRLSLRERFQLAFLPGLEGSRFVLAVHKPLGWAKVSVESLEKGEPIRLRPWTP